MWQRLLREIRMLQTGIIVAFESIHTRRSKAGLTFTRLAQDR